MHGLSAVFEFEAKRFRVLGPVRTSDGQLLLSELWCIDVDDPRAWPVQLSAQDVAQQPKSDFEFPVRQDLSPLEKKLKEKATTIIDRLRAESGEQLFYPALRKAALSALVKTLDNEAKEAKKLGLTKETCTEPTLYKWLRRYWQRGQRPAALAPDYPKCGKVENLPNSSANKSRTANRGRPSPRGVPIMQLMPVDMENMRWAINTVRAGDTRKSLKDTHVALVSTHYSHVDGNGDRHDLPEGLFPSLKQLRSYYYENYSFDVRVTHRVGAAERTMNYRPQTGSAIRDTFGPGQFYEVDATPIECRVVTNSRKTIIGKPTLYLVVDRWSRLIVGYYLGFEKESWMSALQAILSLAQDKQALCQKYGVKYDPKDWPAHGYFPSQFTADRGSAWTSQKSWLIVKELGITVENLPARRPEMKAMVENAINLILRKYRKFERSSDPDANQRKRQKTNFKRYASATIDEFHNFTLEAIKNLNRTQYTEFPMTAEMLEDGVKPMPLQLWAYRVAQTGLPRQYSEKVVRQALLPRAQASVNEHGIHINKCTYWSQQSQDERWFDIGHGATFKVPVSFDPRNVDRIYVYPRNDPDGEPHVAHLSERSIRYAGLSLAEVTHLEGLRSVLKGTAEDENRQEESRFIDEVRKTSDQAYEEMKEQTLGASIASRTKDAKEVWEIARQKERRENTLIHDEAVEAPAQQPPALRVVSSLPTAPQDDSVGGEPAAPAPSPAAPKQVAVSMADRLAAMKRDLLKPQIATEAK